MPFDVRILAVLAEGKGGFDYNNGVSRCVDGSEDHAFMLRNDCAFSEKKSAG